jgi:hypothetical protein
LDRFKIIGQNSLTQLKKAGESQPFEGEILQHYFSESALFSFLLFSFSSNLDKTRPAMLSIKLAILKAFITIDLSVFIRPNEPTDKSNLRK